LNLKKEISSWVIAQSCFWILLEGKGKFGEEVPCNLKPKAGF
jgi:hypothetical protein